MGKDLLKGREPQLWFEERMHGYKVKKDQSIYEKTKCPTEKKKNSRTVKGEMAFQSGK